MGVLGNAIYFTLKFTVYFCLGYILVHFYVLAINWLLAIHLVAAVAGGAFMIFLLLGYLMESAKKAAEDKRARMKAFLNPDEEKDDDNEDK